MVRGASRTDKARELGRAGWKEKCDMHTRMTPLAASSTRLDDDTVPQCVRVRPACPPVARGRARARAARMDGRCTARMDGRVR
jgi:hypothetical protein